jgi:hypothetical protein
MMKPTLTLLAALLLAPLAALHADDNLVVYPTVPGLAASEHYKVRVRSAPNGEWKDAYAWVTACKTIEKTTDAYFDTLASWTHTYVNFETTGAVEVEIARADGKPIRSAAVHPKRKSSACLVKDGKAFVTLDKPCLVAVDIDGQMDGQDTGKGYKGPPIHTISIFTNPPLVGKPKPDDPGVMTVKPGERPPTDGKWTTLYFLPGVHDIGLAYPLRANCNYYIPGDAIVYGTLSNTKWGEGHHIRIFGHGTLSGARLKHPKYAQPPVKEKEHGRYRPIEIVGTTDTRVEGITIADSATHSLMLINPYKEGHPNEVKWAKIFTWRANGDGINPFGNTLIEDCFLRTQDDSLYVNGLGIRRCVLWNDANGSSFVLSSLPQLKDCKLVVEDCDVIYSRAKWHHWSGGRVFNMRGESKGEGGSGVIFRNINIEDPRPTLQQFFLCMTVPKPYSKEEGKGGTGDLSGIHFQNVSIAAPSVLGEPQMLWGQSDARIRNLTFENLTVAGKPVRDASFFKTNDFVDGLKFAPDRKTSVGIQRDKFHINGQPTYKGRIWNSKPVEGLLLNSRMVQATFDDRNPETVARWAYPDTKKWDADRNTAEFLDMMPTWRKHGLLAVTLNLQGGSPEGYSKTQPWYNSAINADGTLDEKYMARLAKVIDKADELGMVVILGLYYFGQDERVKDEKAVIAGVDAAVDWIIAKKYTNVLVEVNNECNVKAYDHDILKPERVHELIERVKKRSAEQKHPLLTGTSYGGGAVPKPNVVKASDFLLLHGNGVKDPKRITEMVQQTRKVDGYRPMPILFNEDDHFNFDKPVNNFAAAVGEYASWGYFDYRMKGEGFDEGYQSVPVNWKTRSDRKKGFFKLLSEITGEIP